MNIICMAYMDSDEFQNNYAKIKTQLQTETPWDYLEDNVLPAAVYCWKVLEKLRYIIYYLFIYLLNVHITSWI